jgi:hypothetical protein
VLRTTFGHLYDFKTMYDSRKASEVVLLTSNFRLVSPAKKNWDLHALLFMRGRRNGRVASSQEDVKPPPALYNWANWCSVRGQRSQNFRMLRTGTIFVVS